ncbi:hypothetical protein ACFVSU_02650 [Microbacterium sp. NPDC058062]|uniref:hypothetical protein n=1 Tax=Microbacterium sp. NPDC058062 TaxID=3346320 RepID=UPI0036DEFF25
MTTDDTTPGAAGIAEAEKRFGAGRNQPGIVPTNLEPGDPGYDGVAAAQRILASRTLPTWSN